MWRIIDINSDNIVITADKNNIVIKQDGNILSKIHLSDVGCVLIHNNGTLISKNALNIMADNNVSCVFCDKRYMPNSIVMPVAGNYHQSARCLAQANAKEPVKKQLWKTIIQSKIKGQCQILTSDEDKLYLTNLRNAVKSGDATNREAVSARYYWKKIFGTDFIRDYNGNGINAHLNYGYAILRSTVTRYIVGAGLNPALGIFHHNKLNNFCLADDLIEPFRPIVDKIVLDNKYDFSEDLGKDGKRILATILVKNVSIQGDIYPVYKAIEKLCTSVALHLCDTSQHIVLPDSIVIVEKIE